MIPVVCDATAHDAVKFLSGIELDELAEQRRRWREAGAGSEEIARWSAAWLGRHSPTARRSQCP
jgi:hypothetical protein